MSVCVCVCVRVRVCACTRTCLHQRKVLVNMPLTVEEVAEEAKPEEVSSLAPEFLEKPRYQTVNEGETVTFKGTVEAAPQPEVSIPVCLKGDQKQSNISAVGIE